MHQIFILNAKEVLISQKDGEFTFRIADGTARLSGRDYEFRLPTLRREELVRSEDLSGELKAKRKCCNRQKQMMTLKPAVKGTSSTAIKLNHEYNLCVEGRNIPFSTEIH